MVNHDGTFRGLALAPASARDLAPWQAQGFLPSLAQVLQYYGPRCFLDVEIKDPGLEPEILDLLVRHPPAHGFVLTSFLPGVLERLHDFDPDIQLGLIWDQPSAPWQSLPVQWALPERRLLNGPLAKGLLSAGKRIGTWTTNDPAEMLLLASLGAEILISDDTARLVNTFSVI